MADTVITDRHITLIADTIANNYTAYFASVHLEFDQSEIDNCTKEQYVTAGDMVMQGLRIWKSKSEENTAVKLRDLIVAAAKDNIVDFQAKDVLDGCTGSDCLTPRHIGRLSRLITLNQFKAFTIVHLGVDMGQIEAHQPARTPSAKQKTIEVLKLWRNKNGENGTLGCLRDLIVDARQEGDLDMATEDKINELIAEEEHGVDDQATENFGGRIKRNYKKLLDEMEAPECADILYGNGELTNGDYETILEKSHRKEKAQLILSSIMGKNSQQSLANLQQALVDCKQDHLAKLLH